ncbi:RmlC-like cupin domain-containing protein [Apiospora rasikravindrae]|uniref:RmlC-like cupin domain-containing protein n=1 Tax=Apiospora rasikravindrae TaxID=990691 RepID=A0ABR1S2P3_9PEZI
MPSPTSIPKTFSSFTEHWSPRLVAAVNDQHVKIAKIDGAFIWHAHPDSDELFYLLAGELTLELERKKNDDETEVEEVVMQVGDMFVVPKGVRHRPVARQAHIMMVEKRDTVNTGDMAGESGRTRVPRDVRA